MNRQVIIPENIDCHVQLPQSKSIAVRAMLISALAGNRDFKIEVQASDDIKVMAQALGCNSDHINVEGAGTAMRFLTAFFAMQEGREVVVDGSERMRQRPIGVLVDTLRHMGASIEYLGAEGSPPLKIAGRKLHGGEFHINGSVSSQFISALLMIAPLCGGITLFIDGDIVSRPYIDMTLGVMRYYGIDTECKNHSIFVPQANYLATPFKIEADWSAASYWFALKALLPQSNIELSSLNENSLQGDRAIVEMMEPLGVRATFENSDTVTLFTDATCLVPTFYERDMAATPDLVPTLVVTLCLLRVPFSLTGLQSLRIKESDRIEALKVELAKLGYIVNCDHSTMSYDGNHMSPPHEVLIDPHGDHRIAMAMSLAATRHKGITIKDAQVVTKSYPSWWETLCLDN